MKSMILGFAFSILLLLVACSGTEKLDVDSIPPLKPDLLHHLGDTGDPLGNGFVNYHNNSEFEHNGIDATQGGNWIQLEWEHLLDIDLDKIEIYRFNLEEYQEYMDYLDDGGEEYDFTTKIDEIEPELDRCDDTAPGLLEKNCFYYIKAIDESGNWTKSDTVCYRLIDKPALISPIDPGPYDLSEVVFEWELGSGIPPSNSRLLVFDENFNLIWQYDPLDFDDLSISYEGPTDLDTQIIYWRVEAFGNSYNAIVNNQFYLIESGSESDNSAFYIE